MPQLYNPAQASRITSASASAIRNYTQVYARFLSTEATATPRQFTEADLKVIAFARYCSRERNMRHEEVIEALGAGELDAFDWQPPMPEGEAAAEAVTTLVPMAEVRAMQALLHDAQRRETEALDREADLRARIEDLQLQLGEARGAVKSRYRSPEWWRRIFGGRDID